MIPEMCGGSLCRFYLIYFKSRECVCGGGAGGIGGVGGKPPLDPPLQYAPNHLIKGTATLMITMFYMKDLNKP